MPFYVADYVADTQHLKTIEHGAYDLLIWHYWRHGGLPTDEQQLRAITKLTQAEWRRHRHTLAAFFVDWRHKRIDAEIAKANDKHERRQNAGKRGGIATANAKQCSSNAQASSSQPQPQSEREGKVEARKRATRLQKDWWPSQGNIQYALAKHLSLDRVSVEAEKFRNYWTAKSQNATKLDWDATWENWILKAMETGNGYAKPGPKSLAERGRELADQARELERAAGVGRSDEPFGSH